MIINQQGKLFGKVSIVDIGIIFVVLLTISVLIVKVLNPVNMIQQTKSINCEYTITVKNIRQESIDAMQKSIGKPLYDAQEKYLGKVKEISELTESDGFVFMSDGTVAKSPRPERYDIKVKIEAPATKAKGGVLIDGKREILVGSRITMSSPEITVETQIIDILFK